MLVSAVVATCRGRLRRGAIREDGCWLTSRTDGVGFSYELRPDCLALVPVAPMLVRDHCDAFWRGCRLPARSRLACLRAHRPRRPRRQAAHGSPAPGCDFFKPASLRGAEHAAVKSVGSPTRAAARRADASLAHAIAPTPTPRTVRALTEEGCCRERAAASSAAVRRRRRAAAL